MPVPGAAATRTGEGEATTEIGEGAATTGIGGRGTGRKGDRSVGGGESGPSPRAGGGGAAMAELAGGAPVAPLSAP